MKFLKTLICIMTFLLGTQKVFAERVEYGPRPVSVTIPFVDSDRDLVADSITFVFPKNVKSINNKSKFIRFSSSQLLTHAFFVLFTYLSSAHFSHS